MTEWNASAYNRQSTLQETLATAALAHLALGGHERVLDVGCGDGKITARIAKAVPAGSVVGVDPSHDMIRFASGNFGSAEYPNLRFEVGDVRALPYREEFDLVVSFNALHWVPEQEQALRSIRKALRSGGLAQLQFVPEGERKCLEDVIEEVRKLPRWEGDFAEFRKPYAHSTPEEYRALAERVGFGVVRIHCEDGAWDFKTDEGFRAFCRATFVEWTRRLPESEWDAFITDVLERYRPIATERPGEENTFKFYQMQVVLTAREG